jgi:large subunit ribosomal protein L15
LDDLNKFEGEVNPETLKAAGYRRKLPIKVLGKGKLEKALTVKANKFSDSAKAAIEAAGGKAEVI